MEHTDDEPKNIIQQKPPPPPGFRAPDGGDGDSADPAAPTEPPAPAPQETPSQPPPARVARAHGPTSSPGRRIGHKPSEPRLLVPSPDLKPEIISRGEMRPRASSSPELMLLGFPSRHATPARSSLSR